MISDLLAFPYSYFFIENLDNKLCLKLISLLNKYDKKESHNYISRIGYPIESDHKGS